MESEPSWHLPSRPAWRQGGSAELQAVVATPAGNVLQRLRDGCRRRGLGGLARHIEEALRWVGGGLCEVERALRELPLRDDCVHRSASHLLRLGGKRLRPVCVLLAARAALPEAGRSWAQDSGWRRAVCELAVAVELVHTATLFHDDVVDDATSRRGAPAARLLYGNAASIFAGDWLLVEALRRVRRSGAPGALERLLETIDAMIAAEALQLEGRGSLHADAERYFTIVRGKTASLFGWACWAGARAAGAEPELAETLADYGRHLGEAFQLVDDWLDFAGDPACTGKHLLQDLYEGKLTYPVLWWMRRHPGACQQLQAMLRLEPGSEQAQRLGVRIRTRVAESGALEATLRMARAVAGRAVLALRPLGATPVRPLLEAVAQAVVQRDR